MYKIFQILGKPTRLAPIPKPAPDLAEAPILGINVSKILNVAAAIKPIIATSSNFKERFSGGITKATIARKANKCGKSNKSNKSNKINTSNISNKSSKSNNSNTSNKI